MSEQAQQKRPWTKGGPSPNPLGRAAKLAAKPPGSDGVIAPGGFLFSGERKSTLTGTSKWTTFDNLVSNVAIVATAIRIWLDLAGSVKWYAEPNPAGGADAETCAELVQSGLIDARMPKPWRNVVKRQLMGKKFRGFALHAKGLRRNRDGMLVFAELAHRPQWTIDRWIKPTETAPWTGVVQRTRLGGEYPIDRRDLFYSVEDALTDSPDGVGLLRHLVETERIFTRYRQLHGIAVDTDVNGIPVGRAPLQKLAQEAVNVGGVDPTSPAAISAYVQARTAGLRDMLENHVVTSTRSLLLDSLPYYSDDTDGSSRPSGIYEWSIETVKSQIGAIPELRASLDDLNHEMARVMCAEWLLMGDSEGARAVHGDKTQMFGLVINGALDDIADDATRDLAADLTARNGFDVETCCPKLCHEPVATQSVLEAAEMLATLAKAGLRPDDEAIAILRERADLPAPPVVDDAELMAPRGRGDNEEQDDLPDEDEE